MGIIDVHVHSEFSLDRLVQADPVFKKADLTKETYLRELQESNIDYVFSIGKKDGKLREFFTNNVFNTGQLKQEQRELRFLRRIVAATLWGTGNLDQIRNFLQEEVVDGIKLYLGYSNLEATNLDLEPYYQLAGEFQKPVFFHLGECFPNVDRIVHPESVVSILEKYQNQKFILCHLAYPLIDETFQVLSTYENVYADISGMFSFQDLVSGEYKKEMQHATSATQRNINSTTAKKLLFGSDYPIIPVKQYIELISPIFAKEYQEQVFNTNARTLFNLD